MLGWLELGLRCTLGILRHVAIASAISIHVAMRSWLVAALLWSVALLHVPDMLGAALTWILSHQVVHHPLVFGRIFVFPTFSSSGLRLQITVERFGFGNPAGFKNPYFLEAKNVIVVASCSFAHLWNLHAFLLPARFQRVIPFTRVHNERWKPSLASMVRPRIRRLSATAGMSSHGKRSPAGGRTSLSVDWLGGAFGVPREVAAEKRASKWEPFVAQIVTIQRFWRTAKMRKAFQELVRGRWGLITVERVEVTEATLRFDVHDGELNVSGFTRQLAVGEMLSKLRNLKPKEALPNRLQVQFFAARNLKAKDIAQTLFGYEASSDPYFKIKLREKHYVTATQYQTLHPEFTDEIFVAHCTDPSAVLHLSAYDADIGPTDDFLGQWYCTIKHLKNKAIAKQWVPLKNRRFVAGTSGEVLLAVSWTHAPEFTKQEESVSEVKLTALQQLQENSFETGVRLGNKNEVISRLKRFPYLFNVRLICFRSIDVHIQDLFAGHKGMLDDLLSKLDQTSTTADTSSSVDTQKVRVKFIQFTDEDCFKLKKMQGHNLWEVCSILAANAPSQVLSMSVMGGAIAAIGGGLSFNIGNTLTAYKKTENVNNEKCKPRMFKLSATTLSNPCIDSPVNGPMKSSQSPKDFRYWLSFCC